MYAVSVWNDTDTPQIFQAIFGSLAGWLKWEGGVMVRKGIWQREPGNEKISVSSVAEKKILESAVRCLYVVQVTNWLTLPSVRHIPVIIT